MCMKKPVKRAHLLVLAVYLTFLPLANDVIFTMNAGAAAAGASFKVATYNIRATELDSWTDRRANAILSYLKTIDVFGLQEVRDDSSSWLTQRLKDASYARTSTKSARVIFWNTRKFTLTDNGSKLLQVDNNGTTKDIVWVKLKEKTTGSELYIATAHPTYDSEGNRVTQANKAVEYMNSKLAGAPILYLGDMNTALNTKPDKVYQAAGFSNLYATAAQKENTDYASTVQGGIWGSARRGSPIDHIYTKGGVTANSIAVRIDKGGSDHFPVEANISIGNSVALTIGTYNILGYYHGEGSRYASDRLTQIVKNIDAMQADVVGLQEYRDQASGEAKALENRLKGLNATWKMAYSTTRGDSDQLNFIYNTNTVELVSDRAVGLGDSRSGCIGGTIYGRIARFVVKASGQEFLIINVHPTSNHDAGRCDTERLSVVKGALADSEVAGYSNPLFLIGDFNANPTGSRLDERNIERYLKGVGYGNARDIPGAVRKKGGVIDHVYYKKSSIADPTAYEAMNCTNIPQGDPTKYNSSRTCASDHYPVKAVFGSGNSNCDDDTEAASTSNQYRALNNQLLTGSSAVCCATSVSSSNLSGETNAEKAFNFLTTTSVASNGGKPFNAAQAAGMVGNLMIETGDGTYNLKPDVVNGIGAAGIVQWRENRRTALNQFAKKQGTDWTDLKTQLQFMIVELENDYYARQVMEAHGDGSKDVNKGLKNVTDVSEAGAKVAANIIGRWYEIPSISDRYPNREEAAVKAYNDFSNGSAGGSPSTTSGCSQEVAGDFSSTVKSFAWEDGRRGAEQKEAYTQALEGRYKGGNNGNDCGAFVSALMVKSGFEPNYPGTNTSGQRAWLNSNWEKIYDPGAVDVAQLQPGDVAIKTGHVFVWIGDVEGFVGKSAEAALGSNTAPTAITSGNTYSDPSLYTWFRKKAN